MTQAARQSITRSLLLFLAFVSPYRDAAGGTVTYSGSPANIQAAIDALNPGDTLIVPAASYPPITITKPITLIGNPICSFDGTWNSNNTPAITLQGSGSGDVVLSRVVTTGYASAWSSSSGTSNHGIYGYGFSGLYLLDCTINPLVFSIEPVDGSYFGLSGGSGVLVGQISQVVVERSTVLGGDALGVYYPAPGASDGKNGGDGISAYGATVVVLDSYVAGGAGPSYSNESYVSGIPNEPCNPTAWGSAGTGIVANIMVSSNSTVIGGLGGTAFCGGSALFTFASGDPVQLSDSWKSIPSDFTASGALVNNSSWTLSWAGSFAILLAGVPGPLLNIGNQVLLMQPTSVFVVAVITGPGVSIPISLPPSLVGFNVVLQAGLDTGTLSRPVVATLLP